LEQMAGSELRFVPCVVPFGVYCAQVRREKMRHILMLALFFTGLSAASAADDPLTKRNNDASTRVRGVIPQPYRPSRPVAKPTSEDLKPARRPD